MQHNDSVCKILLVADGSQTADAAARFAFSLAAKAGIPVLAVYLLDTATMDYLLQMHIFVEDEREDFERELERKGIGYLARIAALAKDAGIETECVMCRGRFHKEIIAAQRENQASMIVLGDWHKTANRHNNFFDERELLLELADCPVIVVKE